MRKRAQSTYSQKNKTIQELTQQLQFTKKQIQILQSKYESSQKQKRVLKQGNSNLVSKFLFNKNNEDVDKLNLLLNNKQKEYFELKKIMKQLQQIINKNYYFKSNNDFNIFDIQAQFIDSPKQYINNSQKQYINNIIKIDSLPPDKINFIQQVDRNITNLNYDKNDLNSKNYKILINNKIIQKVDLKTKIIDLISKYEQQKKKIFNLQQQNFNLGQQIQHLKQQIQHLKDHSLKSLNLQIRQQNQTNKLKQHDNSLNTQFSNKIQIIDELNYHIEQIKIKNQQYKVKILELQNYISSYEITVNQKYVQLQSMIQQKNKIISSLEQEKVKKLNIQSNTTNYIKNLQLIQRKQNNQILQISKTSPQNNFKNSKITTQKDDKLSESICPTEDLKQFYFNQSYLESSILDTNAINTQNLQNKLNKLQKTNICLDKDNKILQEKIKNSNRQYSKLKLDFLKLKEQSKRKQENYQRKIQTLEGKIQNYIKKAKNFESQIMNTQKEKENQKSILKDIIYQFQQKQNQNKNAHIEFQIQRNKFKQQINNLKQLLQKCNTIQKQLQYQKSKSKLLQKQIQQKSMQFQKYFEQYSQMIQDYKKISQNDKISNQSIRNSDKSLLTVSRQKVQPYISIQYQHLLKNLTKEVQQLKQSLNLQNQRYNIIQSSNKQLRKQLLKMIDQQQKLRKQLINQKIKNRTNSISSKNSRTISSKRFDLECSTKRQQLQGSIQKSTQKNFVMTNQRAGSIKKFQKIETSIDKVQYYANEKEINSHKQKSLILNNQKIVPLKTQRSADSQRINDKQRQKQKDNFHKDQSLQGAYLRSLRQKRFGQYDSLNLTLKQTINNSTNFINKQQKLNPSKKNNVNTAVNLTKNINNKKINENILFSNLTMIKSYTKQKQESDLLTLSNQNKEITFELSQSKSNISKRQVFQDNENLLTAKNQKQEKLKQPQSASKIYIKQSQLKDDVNQVRNNILINKDQVTKSISQLRFSRKAQGSQQKKYNRK